jgi:hypothetical protein
MMSRRRFLKITVSMAAIAALPNLPGPWRSNLLPPIGEIWVPTVAEVAEWLEYYKLAMHGATKRFADIIDALGTREGETDVQFRAEFQTAEDDFLALTEAREAVAFQQGAGYGAGRDGRPRLNHQFLRASHEAFGWYNYWAIGDYDRRRFYGLPRIGKTLEDEYRALGFGAEPLVHVRVEPSAALSI